MAVLPGLAALAVAIIAWFWVQNQPVKDFDHRYFPSTRDINGQFIPIACDAVAGRPRFEGCSPERCGRFIHDNFISSKESDMLKAIVERALSYGGSSSGTNVFDLASGALSYGTKFLDVYQAVKSAHLKDPSARQSLFTTEEADLLDSIYGRIKSKLKDAFGITGDLYLTRPSFFSKIQGAGKSRYVVLRLCTILVIAT